MRTYNSVIDHESLIKQNANHTLGVPIECIRVITRLKNSTWFADIVAMSQPAVPNSRNAPFLTESGSTVEEALVKLHSACSKEAHRHFQTRGFESGPEPENEDNKEESEGEDDISVVSASSSDDEDTLLSGRSAPPPRVVPTFERPSMAAWSPTGFIPTDPRGPGFPRPQPGATTAKPKQRPVNATAPPPRPPPGLPRVPIQLNKPRPATSPFFNSPQNGSVKSVPSLPARIRIDFLNHGTFEIAETIPMTPGEVLTAATRHCDMLTGAKCLRASLKSVTRGGTNIQVQGCVLNLAAMVGALPSPGEVPVFEVEVTKGPAA